MYSLSILPNYFIKLIKNTSLRFKNDFSYVPFQFFQDTNNKFQIIPGFYKFLMGH